MANLTVSSKVPFDTKFSAGSQSVTLKGYNSVVIRDANGLVPFGSVGRTEVEETLWAKIVEANKHQKVFKDGLVFASKNVSSADAEAKEKRELSCGLEGLVVGKKDAKGNDIQDKRLPQSKANRIETATDLGY